LDENIVTFLTGLIQTFTAEDIMLFKGVPSGLFGFVGESGKLYDSDGNYFQSYESGTAFVVSGNAFPQRHNYFYGPIPEDTVLINNNCSRPSGTVDAFYIVNVGDQFALSVVS
jgi:hypothetical protein